MVWEHVDHAGKYPLEYLRTFFHSLNVYRVWAARARWGIAQLNSFVRRPWMFLDNKDSSSNVVTRRCLSV